MTVNTGTILLSLAAGVVIGVIALIWEFLSAVSVGKWLPLILQDTTFVFLSFMITFIVSFPISMGRIRFLQLALEFLGFSFVWLVFSPGSKYLAHHYKVMRESAGKFMGRIRRKSLNKAKIRHRISKKPKKRLDISPPGNI